MAEIFAVNPSEEVFARAGRRRLSPGGRDPEGDEKVTGRRFDRPRMASRRFPGREMPSHLGISQALAAMHAGEASANRT